MWTTRVLLEEFLPNVEDILVLNPYPVWIEAVEVVSAPLLPRAAQVGFLFDKALVSKIRVHVNSLGNAHRVHQAPLIVVF